jgi:PAS domain S-box-containing protein
MHPSSPSLLPREDERPQGPHRTEPAPLDALQRAERLQALHDVALKLYAATERSEIVAGTVRAALDLFGAVEASYFDAPDPATPQAEVGYVRGVQGSPLEHGRRPCPPDLLAVLEEPAAQGDRDGEVPRAPDAAGQEAAVLALAVRTTSRAYGVLEVRFAAEQRLEPSVAAELAILAGQAAAALEKACLLEEERRRTREATILLEIARATGSTLELHQVLDRIVERTAALTGADRASILLLDAGGRYLQPSALYGMDPSFTAAWKRNPIPLEREPLSRAALESGRPVVVSDALTDPRTDKAAVALFGDRSLLVAPLIARGQALGTLFVNHVRRQYAFTPEDVEIIQAIATWAAMAIDNARLYEETRQKGQQLRAAIESVGHALSAGFDLEATLSRIASVAAEIAQAQGCAVSLLEEGHLVVRAAAGMTPETWNAGAAQGDARLAEIALARGAPYYVDEHTPTPLAHLQFLRSQGFAAYLGMPLRAQRETLGALSVYWRTRPADVAEQIRLLSAFAGEAALAIGHARLFTIATRTAHELNAIIQHCSDGIVVYNRERRVSEFNRAMEQISGWSAAEARGRLCSEVLCHFDSRGNRLCDRGCPVQHVLETQRALLVETTTIGRDGRRREIAASYTFVPDEHPDGCRVVAVVRDVTRLKELEQLKVDFVSMISHDLRTPLSLIKGYAATLLRTDLSLSEEQRRRFLRGIDQAADRLARLVENIISARRLETGMYRFALRRVSLTPLLRAVAFTAQEHADGHTLLVDLPDEPLETIADPDEISRVVMNLLSNAFKYSPRGTVVRLRAWAEQSDVHITVSDQGRGLPPDQLERIFEKFYRVPGQEGSERGSGLGLFICKRIVEAHGGRIWAESTPGRGSTFHVVLRRAEMEQAEVA